MNTFGRILARGGVAALIIPLGQASAPASLAQTPPASPANGAAPKPSASNANGASNAKVTRFGNVSVSGYRRLTGTLSGESAASPSRVPSAVRPCGPGK